VWWSMPERAVGTAAGWLCCIFNSCVIDRSFARRRAKPCRWSGAMSNVGPWYSRVGLLTGFVASVCSLWTAGSFWHSPVALRRSYRYFVRRFLSRLTIFRLNISLRRQAPVLWKDQTPDSVYWKVGRFVKDCAIHV